MADSDGLDQNSGSLSETLEQNPNPSSGEEIPDPESKTTKTLASPNKKQKQKQTVSETEIDAPAYSSPFQDEKKDGFAVSDLVWGKVRSHPWWPGEIFDPADASELALKHQKKNHYLVAYFGDKTFAWNDESLLKPFQSHFSHMEKQSQMDAFATAVDSSLDEIARRVGSALSCKCHGDDDTEEINFENAGVSEDVCSSNGDVSFIRESFDPVRFVNFISDLACMQNCAVQRLDLAIAKAQLKAFDRSRGCFLDLPEFGLTGYFEEEIVNSVTAKSVSTKKRKFKERERVREREKERENKKHVPDEGRKKKKKLSEILKEKEVTFTPVKVSKIRVGGPSGSSTLGKNKKKHLDSLGDLETKSKIHKKFSKVGECMRRAASRVSQSSPILKSHGVKSQKRSEKSTKSSSRVRTSSEKKVAIKLNLEEHSSSSSSEMLTQLCLAARDPLKGYSFLSVITSFFTGFRVFVSPSPDTEKEEQSQKVVRSKRGRGNSTLSAIKSNNKMRDSYRSDSAKRVKSEGEDVSLNQPKKKLGPQSKKKEGDLEGTSLISPRSKKKKGKEEKEENLEGSPVISSQSKKKNGKEKGENLEGNSVISSRSKRSNSKKEKEGGFVGNPVISFRSNKKSKEEKEEGLEGSPVVSSRTKKSKMEKEEGLEGNPVISSRYKKKKTKEEKEENLEGNSVISSQTKRRGKKEKEECLEGNPVLPSRSKKKNSEEKKEENLEGNSVIFSQTKRRKDRKEKEEDLEGIPVSSSRSKKKKSKEKEENLEGNSVISSLIKKKKSKKENEEDLEANTVISSLTKRKKSKAEKEEGKEGNSVIPSPIKKRKNKKEKEEGEEANPVISSPAKKRKSKREKEEDKKKEDCKEGDSVISSLARKRKSKKEQEEEGKEGNSVISSPAKKRKSNKKVRVEDDMAGDSVIFSQTKEKDTGKEEVREGNPIIFQNEKGKSETEKEEHEEGSPVISFPAKNENSQTEEVDGVGNPVISSPTEKENSHTENKDNDEVSPIVSSQSEPKKGISVISDANGSETEECMPTALVLNFNESDEIPTERDLNCFFSRFGPLKESETEVSDKVSRAQVVFKRRVDAELAFNSAGKINIFGPALVSYRLSYLPHPPPANNSD